MKCSFTRSLLVLSLHTLLATNAMADRPRPRPAFMPSTPSATKAVATYSPAELVGAVITLELPNGHPFGSVTTLESLKSTWPGAKDATKIDAMMQIVLDAPAGSSGKEVLESFENIRFVIQEIMDVSDKDKADAFVRIVAAQTDPNKAKNAKVYAKMMFMELLDPRLLAFEIERLDDATEHTELYKISENRPRRKFVVRQEAKRSILWTLNHTLKMEIDETPFTTADEAANCAALKTWLMANWAQITNKCAQVKAAPDRVKPMVNIQPWDARW